jgi:hypothetical protein
MLHRLFYLFVLLLVLLAGAVQPPAPLEKPKKEDPKKSGKKPKKGEEEERGDKKEAGEEGDSDDPDGPSGYTLERWDFTAMKPDSAVLVIGKRRYGKTIWTEWMLYNLQKFFYDGAYVFTATKHNQVSHILAKSLLSSSFLV